MLEDDDEIRWGWWVVRESIEPNWVGRARLGHIASQGRMRQGYLNDIEVQRRNDLGVRDHGEAELNESLGAAISLDARRVGR